MLVGESGRSAAAHVLAQVFAVEIGPARISVNVVAPGSTDTPMIAGAAGSGQLTGYKPSGVSPLRRIGTVDDVADAVFLLSPSAAYINGAVLPDDGEHAPPTSTGDPKPAADESHPGRTRTQSHSMSEV